MLEQQKVAEEEEVAGSATFDKKPGAEPPPGNVRIVHLRRSDRIQVLEPLPSFLAALGRLDEREGPLLAVNLECQLAGTNHRRCHPDIAGLPVGQPYMNPLKIRLERTAAQASGLLADAAQVLGLAALGLVIAERGLLAADFAFTTH